MKRIVFLLSAILSFYPVKAQVVPWYMRKDFGKEKKQEKVQKKTQAETQESILEKVVENVSFDGSQATDSSATLPKMVREEVIVTLLLPFTENGSPNPNALDFYSGALMAAKKIGEDGIKLRINAIDCHQEYDTAVPQASDIVIGPVDSDDIAIAIREKGIKTIISPLDPKSEHLADSLSVIQVPSSTTARAAALGKWLAEDLRPDENLYVVRENADTVDPISRITLDILDTIGIHYSFINGNATISQVINQETKARILAASDKEWFVRETIRNVSAIGLLNNNVSLYASSKVRNFENLEVELLHNCNLHICPTYSVNYSDKGAIAFILGYRALFQCEPNSFAFHGYDTVTYLTTAFKTFGPDWPTSLRYLKMNGLQASFDFSTEDGRHNTAVRRMTYNRDFSISVE